MSQCLYSFFTQFRNCNSHQWYKCPSKIQFSSNVPIHNNIHVLKNQQQLQTISAGIIAIICPQTSASCSSSGLIRWSCSTGRLVALPAIIAEPRTGSHSQNNSIFQMNNCTRRHTFIYIYIFSELLGNWRAQQCMSPQGLPVMEVFVVKTSRWVVCTVSGLSV